MHHFKNKFMRYFMSNNTTVTYLSNLANPRGLKYYSIEDIADMIKSPSKIVEKTITQVRNFDKNNSDEKSYVDNIKAKLPAFIVAGKFTDLGADSFVKGSNTNIIQLDYDYLTDEQKVDFKEKFIEMGNAVMVFESPTGTGLKVLLKIDGNIFDESIDETEKDITIEMLISKLNALGLNPIHEIHGQCLDTKTLHLAAKCYLSYDVNLFYNPNALPFSLVEDYQLYLYMKRATHVFKLIDALAPGKIQPKNEIGIIGVLIGSDYANKLFDEKVLKKIHKIIKDKLKQVSPHKVEHHFKSYLYGEKRGFNNPNDIFKIDSDTEKKLLSQYPSKDGSKTELNKIELRDFIRTIPFFMDNPRSSTATTYMFKDHWILKHPEGITNASTFIEKIVIPLLPEKIQKFIIGDEKIAKSVFEDVFLHAAIRTGISLKQEATERLEDVVVFQNCIMKMTKGEPVRIRTWEEYYELTPERNNERINKKSGPIYLDYDKYKYYDYFNKVPFFIVDEFHSVKNDGEDTVIFKSENGINKLLEGIAHVKNQDDEYVFNYEKYKHDLWHACKYVRTDRIDRSDLHDRKRIMWIFDQNQMDEGQVGKSVLAKMIIFMQPYAGGPNRSNSGVKSDFAMSMLEPEHHTTLFCDDVLSDMSTYYPLISGDGFVLNRKNREKITLSFEQIPNVICTSNTLPLNYFKKSTRGRCDFIIVSNYFKDSEHNLSEEVGFRGVWNTADYNTYCNDLFRMAAYNMRNMKKPKFNYDPLKSAEIEIKVTGVTSKFAKFLDVIIDLIRKQQKKDIGSKKVTFKIKKGDLYAKFGKFCDNEKIPVFSAERLSKTDFFDIFKDAFNEKSIFNCEINNDKSQCIFYYDINADVPEVDEDEDNSLKSKYNRGDA